MKLMPNVAPELLDPEFWLARLDAPDAVVLDPAGIAAFNAQVHDITGIPDPFKLPDVVSADTVRGLIPAVVEKPYYDLTGVPLTADLWASIRANMALDTLPDELPARFGLITRRTDLRAYPTAILATGQPGDLLFDEFQETSVDAGWPAAVLHTSADGRWLFVLTPLYWGWLRANDVALAESRSVILEYLNAEPFMVVAASRAGIAMPDGDHVTVEMATRLPLIARGEAAHRVLVPRCDGAGRLALAEGYIGANDISWHEGYLPCTQRTAITQAFSVLGEPYSWGGTRLNIFGRDCSHFVKDVWGTTGVRLPRNSGQQGKVGVTPARFEPDESPADRADKLRRYVPAGSLLILPGHVMMYLGDVDGRPYAIHDLWRYRRPDGDTMLAGQVVVSDLPLEPSEKRHTLLERLTNAQFFR